MKKWMVAAKKADFDAIAARYGISPVTARLLRNRGLLTDAEIGQYLSDDLFLHDAALLPDAIKAAEMLAEKIRLKKTIRVVGDYDVDGVCATAVLIRGLTFLGAACDYRIPHRVHDGYGINRQIIEEAALDGIDTILTCDNGIAAEQEIAHAKEQGMTVIVTDHHELPVDARTGERLIPGADAVVDPKRDDSYPFPEICGAFVAYQLLRLLFPRAGKGDIDSLMLSKQLTEIVALATVCDVMPLKDENRSVVKVGFQRMAQSAVCGLRALIAVTGLSGHPVSAYHAGFVLGPCINATGRLDSAVRGVELLLTENEEEALRISTDLKALNESRKHMTARFLEEAKEKIGACTDKIIVVFLPDAHESVAGIVAGRLKEAFSRPVIVLTLGEDHHVKGSARSVPAYDIFQALSACADLFVKFGGHPMAAGMTLRSESDVEVLRRRLNEACTLTEDDFAETLHLDMELPVTYADEVLLLEWKRLAPFGNGNERPLFAARDITLLSGRALGKDGRVGKYTVADQKGEKREMILFHEKERFDAFLAAHFGEKALSALYGTGMTGNVPVTIKIAYYPDINEFRGQRTIQLVLEDYRI